MRISSIEKQLGIEAFAVKTSGVGGRIRQTPEDFKVEEVLVDGSTAELDPELPLHLKGTGRYLICLLVKRNWDTILVARKIARQLGVSERRVQIAGIKDKKAVTAQHISIENVKLKHLQRIRIKDTRVHPLRYSPNMVFPHMLFGNRFHLTLRNIRHSVATIQERMGDTLNALNTLRGAPNFFGHQRFGTIRPVTHLVGKALAQNQMEKAALTFLAYSSPHENPSSREARRVLMETQDYKRALENFSHNLLYERLMLSHLAKHPKEYIGAFRRLPSRLRRLFVQAYQSHLFNRFLSQRIKSKIPLNEPQIGDYVVNVDSHRLPTYSYTKATSSKLRELRAAVEKGEQYVAIPIIGYKQSSSEGEQGRIEQSILNRENMTQASFRISSMPEVSAAGTLRAATTPLIDFDVEKPAKDELNPNRKKLEVSFTLHRGCYATVVLREFMKPPNPIKAGF